MTEQIQDDQAILASGMSQQTTGLLVQNLNNVTRAGAAGLSIQDMQTAEVTLYVRLLDDSSSMLRHQHVFIDAANRQLDALLGAKSHDSIVLSTWIFNQDSRLLHSYVALEDALRLDGGNYAPGGTTHLYDAMLDGITSAVAYAERLRKSGMHLTIKIVVFTDGDDVGSKHSAGSVKTVVEDLMKQEIYTVALVAFGTDAASTADAMGIPAKNVIKFDADEHGIRMGMDEVSASVINASIGNVNVSGGFFS